jgi:hypothetical protein
MALATGDRWTTRLDARPSRIFRDHPGEIDFRPPGKIFVDEYAKFIAKKNEKLGSANKLSSVREALSAKS